jgi:hypothetical protein
MPENNERVRPMTKREMKRLLSAKLRDPLTSTREFVSMLPIIRKLSPEWTRLPRRVAKESDVNDMVLHMERQERLKRAKVKV